ncbi:NrfD/PsrC family molybdoenzyme membrane anchor subunit [Eggerthella lenta]|uniref:NrfD/PsrC family molybdoenzyme membrane anchor subunit n=1 Tax=Eggerthella lenta TaxID=84112 RepID=UPI000DF7294C|nr:NrfD/PsrC family molybdoenzyme membrane anchor subunit [Eggerthella lenta]RDC03129.1 polysulfide reductase [Eggerthella lenta]
MSLLIVAYLFLGGAGSGAFVVLAYLDVRYADALGPRLAARGAASASAGIVEKRHFALLLKRGYAAAFATLALGALCLLADVGRPEAAYLLFTRPTWSYISVGTFSLSLCALCAFVVAVIGNFALPAAAKRVKPIALAMGFVAALFVMTYTGVFLQSMNAVALWQSPLLVILFVLSALSTGVAEVFACSGGLSLRRAGKSVRQRLARLDLAIIVLELAVCALCLAAVSGTELGRQSTLRLLEGDYAALFVGGFAVCGLLAPGTLDTAAATRRCGEGVDLAIACLVLIGGFCLRASLVGAGIHTSV